jgi:hypothetical protein
MGRCKMQRALQNPPRKTQHLPGRLTLRRRFSPAKNSAGAKRKIERRAAKPLVSSRSARIVHRRPLIIF